MHDAPDDEQFLAIAESVADGRTVDWAAILQDATPEEIEVLTELRSLEGVARLGDQVPATWGPFAIVGEIGRGAFGTVYRAFDPELQREVALKVIRPHQRGLIFDADRALTEARRLAKIDHRNVVRVYRADRLGDEVGMSMELLSGETLDALVRQRGPLSASEAALIGVELCSALSAVHGTDTLHGDVKAHNVMRSARGAIVLMDFGTSKDLALAHAADGHDFAGTPLYLAPEVFAGGQRTRASDIYSLGVLLYYLVSAKYPVEGSTRTEIGRQHTRAQAKRPLRDARPDLPDSFVSVVERALADDPRQRYASAGEFESALRLVLHGAADRATPIWKKVLLSTIPVLGLLLAGAFFLHSRSPSPVNGPESSPPGLPPGLPAARAVTTTGTYNVDAAIFRDENGAEVRLAPNARIAPGDKLFLELQASVPTYVYVINEDERGESYLLFPLPGQSVANPLAPGRKHRLPGERSNQPLSWQVTSAGGREHFLIFVSPTPSPSLERLFASLPQPTEDQPLATRLTGPVVDQLRGIGGIVTSRQRVDHGIREAPEFSALLPPGPSAAQGLWVRQITFENR